MRRVILVFLVACARDATPVNLAENGSIGTLASASASTAVPAPRVDLLEVAHDQLVLPSPVLYRVGSDQLLPESDAILQRVLELMRARPDVQLLRVEVHTDSMGMASYNLALSEKRAIATARWLIDHGVDCARLDAVGYGQTRPIAPNTTAEERAKNRRTTFVITTGTPSQKLCP